MQYQTVYRQNEAVGRHVAESLNWHVTWWSAGQALIIVITGVGQILVLRRFFTDRRSLQTPTSQCNDRHSHSAVLPVRP